MKCCVEEGHCPLLSSIYIYKILPAITDISIFCEIAVLKKVISLCSLPSKILPVIYQFMWVQQIHTPAGSNSSFLTAKNSVFICNYKPYSLRVLSMLVEAIYWAWRPNLTPVAIAVWSLNTFNSCHCLHRYTLKNINIINNIKNHEQLRKGYIT